MFRRDDAPDPRRPLLVTGLGLLGLSVAVFLASMLFAAGGPQPVLQEAAGRLRGASAWLFLAGLAVTLLWIVLSWLARTPGSQREGDATNRR
jgi:hypothetical protein